MNTIEVSELKQRNAEDPQWNKFVALLELAAKEHDSKDWVRRYLGRIESEPQTKTV